MKVKPFIFSMVALVTATTFYSCTKNEDNIDDTKFINNPLVPDSYKIVLKTAKPAGEQIQINVNALKDDKANVWIDLNNDGRQQAEEKVSTFDKPVSYTIQSKTITIYGKVSELNVENNNLTELDLTRNTLLNKVDCQNNLLTSLNLQHNKDLTDLSCSHNKLHNLNFQNNAKLEEVDCSNNQLQSINAANNERLIDMDCSHNQLQSLNFEKAVKLRKLDCAHNQLQNLDCSKNRELEKLDCSTNHLKTLQITNNEKLYQLDCSENILQVLALDSNKELQALMCNNNQLKSLQIINNKKLTYLDASKNPQLTEINLANENNRNFVGEGDEPAVDVSQTPATTIYVDYEFDPSSLSGNKAWKKEAQAKWVSVPKH